MMETEEYKSGYSAAYDDLEEFGLHHVVEREFLMGDQEGSEWLNGYRKAMFEMLEKSNAT